MAKKRVNLKALSKNITQDAMLKEFKSIAILGFGVIAGSYGGKFIDKTLKVNPSDTSVSLKKLIRPLVLIGVGAVGSIKASNPYIQNLAKGIAISGILKGVNVLLSKDLLSGLEGFTDTDAYGEPIGTIQNMPLYVEAESVGSPDNETLLLGDGFGADLELPELQAVPDYEAVGASDDNETISSTDDENIGEAEQAEITGIQSIGTLADLGETIPFQEIL